MADYPSDAISVGEAAARLGISPDTIKRWGRNGHIQTWKVGPTAWGKKRRVYVSLSELLRCTEPAARKPRPNVAAGQPARRRRKAVVPMPEHIRDALRRAGCPVD